MLGGGLPNIGMRGLRSVGTQWSVGVFGMVVHRMLKSLIELAVGRIIMNIQIVLRHGRLYYHRKISMKYVFWRMVNISEERFD